MLVRESNPICLAAVQKSFHFPEGNGAVVVGIHCLEDALVCRLQPSNFIVGETLRPRLPNTVHNRRNTADCG